MFRLPSCSRKRGLNHGSLDRSDKPPTSGLLPCLTKPFRIGETSSMRRPSPAQTLSVPKRCRSLSGQDRDIQRSVVWCEKSCRFASCPLYPRQRTFVSAGGMSEKCQHRTWRIAARAAHSTSMLKAGWTSFVRKPVTVFFWCRRTRLWSCAAKHSTRLLGMSAFRPEPDLAIG